MEAFEQSFMGFEPVEKSAPIESFMYTNWVKKNIQNMDANANQSARGQQILTDSQFQWNLYFS